MSLIVCPYKRLADGSVEWLNVAEHGSELAGFESTRQTFWGSDTTKALGLLLLPMLASADIWAEGADLDLLETEIDILCSHLDLFPDQQEYWQIRLANVRKAVQSAKQLRDGQGGVYIG
jgi:hypothetical protein